MQPKKIKTPRKLGADYIDNKVFTESVIEWKESIKNIKDRKNWPRIPEYIGSCFLKLVNNYGNRLNFKNYTYLDEMKYDAILACVKYAHNFNPEKSQNAFAYFTTIIHYSFIQTLNKEKKQADIRQKAMSEMTDICEYNYNNVHLEDSSGSFEIGYEE